MNIVKSNHIVVKAKHNGGGRVHAFRSILNFESARIFQTIEPAVACVAAEIHRLGRAARASARIMELAIDNDVFAE